MIISITILILAVAILLLQLQIIHLKKSLRITDDFVADIATFLMISKFGGSKKALKEKGKKRGRPAKTNKE
jgi:hypothetical protein